MRTVAFWLTWAVLLACSIMLTVLVAIYESTDAEADVIRAVQEWPVPGGAFSNVVRGVTTTPFVLAFGAVLVVVLWWRGVHREAILLAVLLILLAPAQAGLKFVADRPRPDEELIRVGFSSPSFPAGHVMGPTVVYGFLLYVSLLRERRGWWRAAAVAWSVIVLATTGVVNVYLGVHWPTDVLGGYLWGLVLLLPAAGLALRGSGRA